MVDYEDLAFNVCAFVTGLFLLEWSADKFVDQTVVVAKRLGLSPALVSLLTAGAEWEELAVVVAAVTQKRSNLALGNVIGSSISNILGAFALGLLFHPGRMTFDRSSKMYTAILLAITTLVSVFLFSYGAVKGIAGPFLLFLFVLYVGSIAYAIYRGIMAPPEDSDSDSSDSESEASDSSDSESELEDSDIASETTLNASNETVLLNKQNGQQIPTIKVFLEKGDQPPKKSLKRFRKKPLQKMEMKPVVNKRPKPLKYHILRLLMGFLALSVSCYVLSHSISSVGDDMGLSGTLIGITVLSLATTLPEKFIAILGGSRGQGGIVIANTVGSNIFLLTLCAGTLFVFGDSSVLETGIHVAEIGVMWLSAAAMALCVFCGADRRVGIAMLVCYAMFIVAEFTVFRNGEGPAELGEDLFRLLK